MHHKYLDETIDFNVEYKKRKTMGIYIDTYGNITLRVPKDTEDKMIIEVVEKKWDWIITKSKEMKKKTKGHREKEYKNGETFLYLGKTLSLMIECITKESAKSNFAILKEDKLYVYVTQMDDDIIKQTIKRFYYQECKSLVESRIKLYQKNFKVKPRSIRIADNKSNWGSCDSNYKLTFNWKLAMAPLDIIDYVVVHELCHMVHLNHDRSFWRLVGKTIPDYKVKMDWLNANSWKMIL